MIYFCADDYGLNSVSSNRILECIHKGVLNKVSVFPNLENFDINQILKIKDVRISLHLNLVEGKCMAEPNEIDLLSDEKGNFKHSFGGLFRINLFNKKRFEQQLYKEIQAQVLFFKKILPDGISFCIDSHQHTHMIPAVFKTLIKVLDEQDIHIEYLRVPIEPLLPYILTPSLYFTYSAVNIIKQWLLNFLWLKNKKIIKNKTIPYGYFFGILFSGKMDEKRVKKVLPYYLKLSERTKKDIEVLFHPGYVDENETDFNNKNIKFTKFYFSKNRKTEFECATKISERSVF